MSDVPFDTLGRLANQLKVTSDGDAPSDPIRRRLGVVDSINGAPPTSVNIKLGGSTTVIPTVKFLQSYYPVVGDVVWVDLNGHDLIVVGTTNAQLSTSYTPAFTASGGAPTLGTGGFTQGSYVLLGGKMCWAQFRVKFGTASTAAGAGVYLIQLPFVARSPIAPPIGVSIALDIGVTVYPCNVEIAVGFNLGYVILRRTSDGVGVSNTTPFAWGINDELYGSCTYEMV